MTFRRNANTFLYIAVRESNFKRVTIKFGGCDEFKNVNLTYMYMQTISRIFKKTM